MKKWSTGWMLFWAILIVGVGYGVMVYRYLSAH